MTIGGATLSGVLLLGAAVPATAAPPSCTRDVTVPAARPPFLRDTTRPLSDGERAALVSRADRALTHPLASVTTKTSTPPSGDRHDYMSLGTYWWPDPADPKAPYVRRDGVMNPARGTEAYDRSSLARMADDVSTLARAWTLTRDQRYADRAVEAVRAWFIDPTTRMNPNMNFAQAVPGRNDGRAAGVIDGADFQRVIEGVGLLDGSGSLTAADGSALRTWFSTYVDWMVRSPIGRDEAAARNNHGIWYDSQLVHFALFAGRTDLAASTVRSFPTRRLAPQIAKDGSLPLEIARTRSFHYSIYALEAAYNVAELGCRLGQDVWNWRSRDGRGLASATRFLAAYRGRPEAWPHPELSWPADELDRLLARVPEGWIAMPIAREKGSAWGTLPDGGEVRRYTLRNDRGTVVTLTDAGAAIASVSVRGVEMTTAPGTVREFVGTKRFGAVVGRYAGRLPGRVIVSGTQHDLPVNVTGVTLHGGDPGWDRRIWSARLSKVRGSEAATFRLASPDGDQGFPGALQVVATYVLDRRTDRLTLDLASTATAATAANPTNHVYWSLGARPDVGCLTLDVPASKVATLDARRVPTGGSRALPTGSPSDLRGGRRLDGVLAAGGLDDLYLAAGRPVVLHNPVSGVTMTLSTDQPAVQVYTGGGFDGTQRRVDGGAIARFAGVALEPQRVPGSPAASIAAHAVQRWHAGWTFHQGPRSACA